MKEKILIQESKPAIYFYSQQYTIRGEQKTRYGFIARLHLEESSAVFKHEHTRVAPKEDRFKLLQQVHANLSPIFVIFKDKDRIVRRLYDKHIQENNAIIKVLDKEKVLHTVWRIDSPDLIAVIQKSLEGENMFIADGHHRYEVSCMYRDLMRQKLGKTTGEESFNYTLAYFTNTDVRGLSILPIHRYLRLEEPLDLDAFIERLREYFDVEQVKDKEKFFFLMEKGGRTEHVLGMYKDKKCWLLRLKNIKILDKLIADKPAEYRSLDVSILNSIIFKKILGYESEVRDTLTYSPDAQEFIAKADTDSRAIAFFLNPVTMDQITAVALKGERMPAKSTYFYPKVLSGLLINKHED